MKFKYTSLVIVAAGLLIGGCKEEGTEFKNPYEGGKEALGIVTNAQQVPVPESGEVGTTVTIAATGLKKYMDSKELVFLFNGEKGDIVAVTDAGIQVKVPARASSGVTSFQVGGQLVFGPVFTVTGRVKVDPTWKSTIGADNTVVKAYRLPDNNIMIMGEFQNYDNKGIVKPIRRITRLLKDGTWDRSLQTGEGANGTVNDMAILNGKYYIAGEFGGYAQRGGDISRITQINSTGIIDTVGVETYLKKTKYVSPFNGGVDKTIRSLYAFNGKLIATGDFTYYLSRRYDQSSYTYKDSTVIDSVDVRQLVRFNSNGTLDKTWRFLPNAVGYKGILGKSLPGGTGRLLSLMHTDGKILCYGEFPKFDDATVGRIVRLNADGTIDATFNPGGAGADDNIASVSYNATTNKYVVVGRFKTFNGVASLNMVQLNYDGSVDVAFKPKVFVGGIPYFVKQLSDGLSVVAGDFKTYDGVARNGFLIVNNLGELASGYNTTGNVLGSTQKLNDVLEMTSEDGKRALLLMGRFSTFDSKPYNNIIRVTIE
ncbi:MAG: DUF5008 domain-containing protein [Bacteroidota bacterium]